jgi:hypothetical protein
VSVELSWLLSLLNGPLVVDRIEGELAVVEAPDGALLDLPLAWFPPDLEEGDRFPPPSPPPSPGTARCLQPTSREAALTTVNP